MSEEKPNAEFYKILALTKELKAKTSIEKRRGWVDQMRNSGEHTPLMVSVIEKLICGGGEVTA